MKPSNVCLPKSEIPLLLSGDLPPDEAAAAESHIAECESCRSVIESIIADSRWWDDARKSLVASATRSPFQVEVTHDTEPTTTTKLLDLLGPTDDPNMLGRIGPYEIIGLLGQGGMGAVFKGFDRSLNRFVAIKMLLPHLAASGAARKRFAREGQAVAAVVDDHVMAIHCVDEWQGVPYLVMTYSRGVSLQKRLSDNGPLEVREILRIGMQAAKGLAAAHAQGIVHRDIKPANIFLDQTVERVQLMDFGLARAVDDASLTRSGTLAGTPQYMSPEQARAETVDHRSDLFSLGSVLYAMCTGHAPFRAESSYSVLRLITDKEPRPIREINPEIPEWLCAIIGKLMSKQAGDRIDSAAQVAELLEDCLAHVQQPTTTQLPATVAKLGKRFGSPTRTAESLGDFRYPPIGKRIAAAAFAFSLIFAGVLIVLELNKGTLTIECEADDVPIRIMQGDNVVERMTVSKSPQNVRVAAGNYVVEVDGDFQGVTIKDGKVSLTRQGAATVEITKNAKLVLASIFQPGNIDGLRFGERHERIDPIDRGYTNIQVAEPGETNKYFASFPTLGNGIEEVGLIVSVEPPHEPTEPSNWKSYLVRASGIRRIKNYSACEASGEGKVFFKPDDEPYTVGYFQLQLDGEEKENVTVDMIAGSAHVNINYVVGLPNEQVRKVLKLDAPTKHSESWLSVNLQTRRKSAWASHLMKLDGWEYDRTRGVPNMVQQEITLKPGGTRRVIIEPAIESNTESIAVAIEPPVLGDRQVDREASPEYPPVRILVHDEEGKPLECTQVSLFQAAAKEGGRNIEISEMSDAHGVAVNRNLPFGHYEVSLRTANGWYLSGHGSRLNVEFEKGLDLTIVAPTPTPFAKFVIRDDVDSQSALIRDLRFGILEEVNGPAFSVFWAPEPEADRGDYETFPTVTNGIEHLGVEIRFEIEKSISQPALTASRINTKWQWSPVDKAKSSRRYLIADGQARGFVNETIYYDKPFHGLPAQGSKIFNLSSQNHRVGGSLVAFGNPTPLPFELEIPVGEINLFIERFLGKPNAAVMEALNWQPQENEPELWLEANILRNSPWIERLVDTKGWAYTILHAGYNEHAGHLQRSEHLLRAGDVLEISLDSHRADVVANRTDEARPQPSDVSTQTRSMRVNSSDGQSKTAPPLTDHDRIQGAWQFDSKSLPAMPAGLNQFLVSFLADRMSMSGPQRAGIGTFSLSPDTVPKQIDCRLTFGETHVEFIGIYEFRDSQLRLCLTEGKQRPKSFDNPPAVAGLMTFALERKHVELPDVDSDASLALSDWSQSQDGAGVFATYRLSIPGIETISQGLAAGGPAVKEFSGVPGFPGKVFTLRYFLPNLSPRGMAFVAGTSFQSSLNLIELAQVAERKRLVKVFSYPDSATGASDPIGAVPVDRPVETPEVEPKESNLKISVLKAGADQADWLKEINATGEIIYGYEIVVR